AKMIAPALGATALAALLRYADRAARPSRCSKPRKVKAIANAHLAPQVPAQVSTHKVASAAPRRSGWCGCAPPSAGLSIRRQLPSDCHAGPDRGAVLSRRIAR